jgi:ribosome recycling factor
VWKIQKLFNVYYKKEHKRRKLLKIAKGYAEAVNRRRKDNEMIKRKRTNNDITQQTKEQATGTLHNTNVEL